MERQSAQKNLESFEHTMISFRGFEDTRLNVAIESLYGAYLEGTNVKSEIVEMIKDAKQRAANYESNPYIDKLAEQFFEWYVEHGQEA